MKNDRMYPVLLTAREIRALVHCVSRSCDPQIDLKLTDQQRFDLQDKLLAAVAPTCTAASLNDGAMLTRCTEGYEISLATEGW